MTQDHPNRKRRSSEQTKRMDGWDDPRREMEGGRGGGRERERERREEEVKMRLERRWQASSVPKDDLPG